MAVTGVTASNEASGWPHPHFRPPSALAYALAYAHTSAHTYALTATQINESSQSGEVDEERQKRAMADPEIQQILADPQMRSILNEMQTDPKKAQASASPL